MARETILQRTGTFYALLETYFPDHRSRQGLLDIPRLARDLSFTNETLYRCARRDEIKVKAAHRLLRFSHENHPEQPLYWDDLTPFVLPDFEELSKPVEG